MPLSKADLYACHVENLRAVSIGIEQVGRQLRSALSLSQDVSAQALLRVYMLLVGAWAECRLLKLLFEDGGFTEQERQTIAGERKKIDQWKKTVQLGFQRRYLIGGVTQLSPQQADRLSKIEDLVENDLRPIIEIRNKLAHAQWAKALNSTGTNISANGMNALANETTLSTQIKWQLIDGLADLVHDLVSTKFAFERDFEDHYRRVTELRHQLARKSYAKYLANLRKRPLTKQSRLYKRASRLWADMLKRLGFRRHR